MPFFQRATLVKRLDFSVGLAEQRSYITPGGSAIIHAKKHAELMFQAASVVCATLIVN